MEFELTSSHYRAVISTYGGSLRQLERAGSAGAWEELIWGYRGNENKKGGQGDVLMPFPGRIRDGKYVHDGREHLLKRNDKDGPNAIHGFLRTKEWAVGEQTRSRVVLGAKLAPSDYEGYPFALEASLEYEVTEAGLRCSFKITNSGSTSAPVGAGFHPYFTVGTESVDGAEARIPATHLIELGQDLLPTGRFVDIRGTELDFLESKRVGSLKLNLCYARLARDADGWARASLKDPVTGRGVVVAMDEAFDYVVVYTGDALDEGVRRKSFAIEPMTCGTDAFNRPEWGLTRLLPGQAIQGTFQIS